MQEMWWIPIFRRQLALEPRRSWLRDTLTQVGSQLFDDARLVYQLTRTKVAKTEGLKSTTETLRKRFAGQGPRPKPSALPAR